MTDSSTAARRVADVMRREIDPLPPGTRLPSQRELVTRFGASASTVAQALALLVQQGLAESRPGAGTFRARQRPSGLAPDTTWQEAALELTDHLASPRAGTRRSMSSALDDTLAQIAPDVVDLNAGYLHPVLRPTPLLSRALNRWAKRPEAWDRPPTGGNLELRDWFAQDIGAGLGRNDVLIAFGGQAALATTLRALTQPGDAIIVESPTYPGTLAAATSAGLRLVPLPLDPEGIVPEHLDEALERSRARVVVVQPLHQNPTGATMSATRRQEVRSVARTHGAFLVEDDFARYLTHADAPVAPAPLITDDADGTVVHVRSLTKPTSPSLRIAAIASRGPVTTRLRDALVSDALLVPALLQHAALDVVTAPGWRSARRDLGTELARRRQLSTRVLTRHLGVDALDLNPQGGYHLWVRVPDGEDGGSFTRAALTRGVTVTPGTNYHVPGHSDPRHVRISYVATPDETELERGLLRFCGA